VNAQKSTADGRLRLAVNQWPERIENDSSPGKLVVGKWTFFAVTYDASRSQDTAMAWIGSSAARSARCQSSAAAWADAGR
jgi:hypothetical protein